MTPTPAERRPHRLAVTAVTGLTVAGAITSSVWLVGSAAARDAASGYPDIPARQDVTSGSTVHRVAGTLRTSTRYATLAATAGVRAGGVVSRVAAPTSAPAATKHKPRRHHHHPHPPAPTTGS